MLRAALITAVVQEAMVRGVPYPGNERVMEGAVQRTRSERN